MNKVRKITYISLSVIALAVFYIMNLLTHLCMDDYCYMYSFADSVDKAAISSFKAIFESLEVHYNYVNGRVVTHFFAHLFCWVDKGIFNIINTLCFALLCGVICYLSSGKLSPKRFFMIILGLWFFTPAFGQSFLWVTGASNYLYGILILLSYMIPLRYYMYNQAKKPLLLTLYAFIFGILAGWTNENTVLGICAFLFLWICYKLIKEHKVPLFYPAGLIGVLIGFSAMLLAPGQRARLGTSGGMGTNSDIIGRMITVTGKFIIYLWPLVLIFILLIAVFIKNNGIRKWEELIPGLLFFISALCSAYSMAASPYIPDRVWSGTVCFMLISIGCVFDVSGLKLFDNKVLSVLCTVILSACFVIFSANQANTLKDTKQKFDTRDNEAHELIENGEKELYLENVLGSGERFDSQPTYGDIIDDKTCWMNVALARYYGANAVYAKEN